MTKHREDTERRASQLRTEAESKLAAAPPPDPSHDAEDLLHELQVHRIELEMQNETLRQAQVALEASRDRYVDLYEFAPVGYLTLGELGLIVEANLTAAALLGTERKNLLHRRFDFHVAVEDRERWQRLTLGRLGAEANRHCELTLRRSDGSTFRAGLDYLDIARGNAPPVLRIAFTDISELTRMRTALDVSDERYRLIFEKSNEAILFGHPDGSIDAANPAACALFGYSEAEICALGRDNLLDPSDPRLALALAERERNGAFHGELRCLGSLGRVFPAQVSTTLFRNSKGEASTSILLRDVSDRTRREAQIKHLNRILRTISACNEVLVRARDEAELLDEICRDVVEIGGYLLAWVVEAGPDGAGTPLTWYGNATAYRTHVELEDDPEHLRHCLVHAALSSRRTQVCNRLDTTPECTFEVLNALGVQAILSLPLLNDDRVHGALTIYSAQAEAFDAAEIGLMEELAADLAYGIAALRTSREQDRYIGRFELALQSTVTALARTLEMRDPYTAGHQQRVSALAVAIAREMGLDAPRIEGLKFGGLIHDIGKIGVPAEILAKPGHLTPIEYLLVQQHPEAGSLLVADIDFPWPMAGMIAQHHERLDGSGYPAGLKGAEILLEARILAVADVVEAMSSHRPYRAGLGMAAALAEIEQGSGAIYDATVAAACLKCVRDNDMKLPD